LNVLLVSKDADELSKKAVHFAEKFFLILRYTNRFNKRMACRGGLL